jgi:hypothetical protein
MCYENKSFNNIDLNIIIKVKYLAETHCGYR